MHSWTKAQISVPLCNFCHFLTIFWTCTVGPKFNFPSHCAIFVTFWQFLAVHSGTKVQFSVPLCNFCHFLPFFDNFLVIFGGFLSIFGDFCHFLAIFDNFWWFLSIFGDFWHIHIMRGACCWPNKKGRALALKQELCLLVCPKSGTLWKICWSIWGSTGARFSQHRIFLFKSGTLWKICCWIWGSTGAPLSQHRIFLFKSGTCPKFAAALFGGALVHDFPNLEFFLHTFWGTTGSRQRGQIKKGRALALKSKNSAFETLWAADDLSSWQDKSSSQRAESQ